MKLYNFKNNSLWAVSGAGGWKNKISKKIERKHGLLGSRVTRLGGISQLWPPFKAIRLFIFWSDKDWQTPFDTFGWPFTAFGAAFRKLGRFYQVLGIFWRNYLVTLGRSPGQRFGRVMQARGTCHNFFISRFILFVFSFAFSKWPPRWV